MPMSPSATPPAAADGAVPLRPESSGDVPPGGAGELAAGAATPALAHVRTPPPPPCPYPAAEPQGVVEPRDGALVDAEAIHVLQDGAVKFNTFSSRPGYPSGGANLRTHLHVEARVRNTTFAKQVWADVHVYTHDGTLAHQETLPLQYGRPTGDGGDVFVLDSAVFQGPIATPGSVTLRPDARVIEYRVYCQLDGQLFTDGALHACYLKPDVATG